MKLKPVHVDGWLYFGIGVFGAMTATFGTDAAYKYMEPYHLFWYKSVSTWCLAGCTALKTFRSTSYSDSLKDPNGQQPKPNP